ncbi:MAG: DUF3096 domain-containing protein [Alphaproteobacteria bacterium]|nr:DUF3096 domain-containing protein [Alphaproteobacteria bacterium]
MNLLLWQSIISVVAGVLIFIRPALLSYIVATYLIIIGVAGLAIALT